MTKSLLSAALAGCLMMAGCGTGADVEAERLALLTADRAWAAAAAAGDIEQVFGYWTDDAVIYPAGIPVVRGKAAIREFVTTNRAQPGFSIEWEPTEAVVSRDATLGYTIGQYRISINDPDGSPISRQGRYVETWRKTTTGGSWKCALEIQSPLNLGGGPDLRPGS